MSKDYGLTGIIIDLNEKELTIRSYTGTLFTVPNVNKNFEIDQTVKFTVDGTILRDLTYQEKLEDMCFKMDNLAYMVSQSEEMHSTVKTNIVRKLSDLADLLDEKVEEMEDE